MSTRRPRDKEKTVEDILTAAKHLFSEKGLHGTSIRDIEESSGVSKGLILHHFGTKEQLYAAVQDLMTEEYIARMAAERQDMGDLQYAIRSAIRNSFLHVKGNREYRRLSLWSYLEGQERNTELEQRFTTALVDTMRAGQQSGLVREDMDAFLMPFIIRGTIDYWIRKERLIQELNMSDEDRLGELEQRLIEALSKIFLK